MIRALVLGVGLLAASAALAQTRLGANIEGGLHWAVSAPQGASWSLVCRFPPATYYASAYDQKHWINRFERSGSGDSRGRLPLNVGYCHLAKIGGDGPVGIALVKDGEARADATSDATRRAAVGFS